MSVVRIPLRVRRGEERVDADPPDDPLPSSDLPPLALLPALRTTTPSEEGGHAPPVCPPWTRDSTERGGPRTGGPTTPLPGSGEPGRRLRSGRRSTALVPGALLLVVIVAVASLAAVTRGEVPEPSQGREPADSSDLTLQVNLAFYNSTTGTTAPVGQTLGAVIFFNESTVEPFDNFTLQNNGNYTLSDFSGENLTDISTVLVDAYAPPGCPACADQEAEDDNASQGGMFGVNLTFISGPTGTTTPPLNGTLATAGDPFPVFLQLVGVGVFAAIAYMILVGGRKLLAPLTSDF